MDEIFVQAYGSRAPDRPDGVVSAARVEESPVRDGDRP